MKKEEKKKKIRNFLGDFACFIFITHVCPKYFFDYSVPKDLIGLTYNELLIKMTGYGYREILTEVLKFDNEKLIKLENSFKEYWIWVYEKWHWLVYDYNIFARIIVFIFVMIPAVWIYEIYKSK